MKLKSKIRLFPWVEVAQVKLHESFSLLKNDGLLDAIEFITESSQSELVSIIEKRECDKAYSLFCTLKDYLLHFHLRHNIADQEVKKSLLKLVACFGDLCIFLSAADSQPEFIESFNRISSLFTYGDNFGMMEVLLHCNLMKKKHSSICCPILRHILSNVPHKDSLEPRKRLLYLLLLRMWKVFTSSASEKMMVVSLASEVSFTSDFFCYLNSSFPMELLMLPDSMSKRKLAEFFMCKKELKAFYRVAKKILQDSIDVVTFSSASNNKDVMISASDDEKLESNSDNSQISRTCNLEGINEKGDCPDAFYFSTNILSSLECNNSSSDNIKSKKMLKRSHSIEDGHSTDKHTDTENSKSVHKIKHKRIKSVDHVPEIEENNKPEEKIGNDGGFHEAKRKKRSDGKICSENAKCETAIVSENARLCSDSSESKTRFMLSEDCIDVQKDTDVTDTDNLKKCFIDPVDDCSKPKRKKKVKNTEFETSLFNFPSDQLDMNNSSVVQLNLISDQILEKIDDEKQVKKMLDTPKTGKKGDLKCKKNSKHIDDSINYAFINSDDSLFRQDFGKLRSSEENEHKCSKVLNKSVDKTTGSKNSPETAGWLENFREDCGKKKKGKKSGEKIVSSQSSSGKTAPIACQENITKSLNGIDDIESIKQYSLETTDSSRECTASGLINSEYERMNFIPEASPCSVKNVLKDGCTNSPKFSDETVLVKPAIEVQEENVKASDAASLAGNSTTVGNNSRYPSAAGTAGVSISGMTKSLSDHCYEENVKPLNKCLKLQDHSSVYFSDDSNNNISTYKMPEGRDKKACSGKMDVKLISSEQNISEDTDHVYEHTNSISELSAKKKIPRQKTKVSLQGIPDAEKGSNLQTPCNLLDGVDVTSHDEDDIMQPSSSNDANKESVNVKEICSEITSCPAVGIVSKASENCAGCMTESGFIKKSAVSKSHNQTNNSEIMKKCDVAAINTRSQINNNNFVSENVAIPSEMQGEVTSGIVKPSSSHFVSEKHVAPHAFIEEDNLTNENGHSENYCIDFIKRENEYEEAENNEYEVEDNEHEVRDNEFDNEHQDVRDNESDNEQDVESSESDHERETEDNESSNEQEVQESKYEEVAENDTHPCITMDDSSELQIIPNPSVHDNVSSIMSEYQMSQNVGQASFQSLEGSRCVGIVFPNERLKPEFQDVSSSNSLASEQDPERQMISQTANVSSNPAHAKNTTSTVLHNGERIDRSSHFDPENVVTLSSDNSTSLDLVNIKNENTVNIPGDGVNCLSHDDDSIQMIMHKQDDYAVYYHSENSLQIGEQASCLDDNESNDNIQDISLAEEIDLLLTEANLDGAIANASSPAISSKKALHSITSTDTALEENDASKAETSTLVDHCGYVKHNRDEDSISNLFVENSSSSLRSKVTKKKTVMNQKSALPVRRSSRKGKSLSNQEVPVKKTSSKDAGASVGKTDVPESSSEFHSPDSSDCETSDSKTKCSPLRLTGSRTARTPRNSRSVSAMPSQSTDIQKDNLSSEDSITFPMPVLHPEHSVSKSNGIGKAPVHKTFDVNEMLQKKGSSAKNKGNINLRSMDKEIPVVIIKDSPEKSGCHPSVKKRSSRLKRDSPKKSNGPSPIKRSLRQTEYNLRKRSKASEDKNKCKGQDKSTK